MGYCTLQRIPQSNRVTNVSAIAFGVDVVHCRSNAEEIHDVYLRVFRMSIRRQPLKWPGILPRALRTVRRTTAHVHVLVRVEAIPVLRDVCQHVNYSAFILLCPIHEYMSHADEIVPVRLKRKIVCLIPRPDVIEHCRGGRVRAIDEIDGSIRRPKLPDELIVVNKPWHPTPMFYQGVAAFSAVFANSICQSSGGEEPTQDLSDQTVSNEYGIRHGRDLDVDTRTRRFTFELIR
jgi:hypothetical protein